METIIAQDKLIEIREKAKEKLRTKHPKPEELPETDKVKLLQELEVHQIELELQNEELVFAQKEARHAAERYTALYNAAPAGFFSLTRDGKIVELNTQAAKMLGNEKDQLLNKSLGYFVTPPDKESFETFLNSVFERKEKQEAEIMLQSEKSNWPLYYNFTGILTENGEECVITAEDITQRKLAIEATIEKQRLSGIGEMASSIAHDFNNSLQAVLGNLELAIHDTKQDNIQAYLNTMRTAIIEAIGRVQQLQRFGGRDQERRMFAPININTIAEEVIAEARPLWKDEAEARGISIQIEVLFGNTPEMCGSEGELRTAFFNIIRNSIEAMPHGGKLTIETGKNANGIFVTITDTGIGMNEESRSRIFQPFFSTKGFNLGRGLGMSSAHSVIKEHHGDIYVKNTSPGQGTSIEVLFPVYPVKGLQEDKGGIEQKKETKVPPTKLNILWVDDDDDIRLVVREMVKQIGNNITMASGGKEALSYLDNNVYDVVITDIGMPEMNGWQLAEIIRHKYGPDIKIAVASGWGAQIKDTDLKKHGITYLLNKPFSILKLKEFLETIKQEVYQNN
jgi:PAS domain S-box-containing protein